MPKYDTYYPRKKDLFKRLRGELLANGLKNIDLSRILNRGTSHVSRCMNGKSQFNLDEQYIIMDAIHRPYCDLHIIFPPGGVHVEESKHTDNVPNVSSSKYTNKVKTQPEQGKPDSAADQVLQTTAEILRLQADLLDALAMASNRSKKKNSLSD